MPSVSKIKQNNNEQAKKPKTIKSVMMITSMTQVLAALILLMHGVEAINPAKMRAF